MAAATVLLVVARSVQGGSRWLLWHFCVVTGVYYMVADAFLGGCYDILGG